MQTLRFLATEKKLSLLGEVLSSAGEKIRVRQIAGKLNLNPGYVSTILGKMEREGLIKHNELDLANPEVRSLKILSNTCRLANSWQSIRKKGILGFGIFGSWAKGSNTYDSDLDIWVKSAKELSAEETSEIRHILMEDSGAPLVSLIVLTGEKIAKIRNDDKLFYCTLLNSFHLGGELFD